MGGGPHVAPRTAESLSQVLRHPRQLPAVGDTSLFVDTAWTRNF